MKPKSAAIRILTMVILTFMSSLTYASEYPNKPIKIVIGQAVGGLSDNVARTIAYELQGRIGQPVVVEAKPGASGSIATVQAARAPADGYTLALLVSSFVTNKYLQKEPGYDPRTSFVPVSLIYRAPVVLSASLKSGFTTLSDVTKSKEAMMPFGSAGAGQMTHLAGELFKEYSGINLRHVPYRGGAQALNDLLGGQIPLQMSTIPLILPHVQAGGLKVLAVAAKEREPSLPNVPTFAESGYPDMIVEEWSALFAPAGTPKEVVDKLNSHLIAILALPSVKEKLKGLRVQGSSPKEAAAFVSEEIDRWQVFFKNNPISID